MNRKDYGAMVPVHIVDEEDLKDARSSFSSNWQKYEFIFKREREKAAKKIKPTVLFITCVVAWTSLTCGITSAIVKHNTTVEVTERVSSELRQGFQNYLNQMKEEQLRSTFLTGDDSKQAAIEEMVEPIAEHIAGLRMDRGVTINGVRTYIWGVDFARLNSGRYGSTIQQVLKSNIEGYVEGHAVRNEDRVLSRELCTAYINGELPDKWTPNLEFAEINADGSVTARSKLRTDSTTKFWGYED